MTDSFEKTGSEHTTHVVAADFSQQFLTFNVDKDEYGVDIMTVREIKGWTEVTRLPNSSEFMCGVMNLRGLILPIYDLRMRFNKGVTQATRKHVVIILAVGERNIGILVDAVSDILNVTADQIKPEPVDDIQEDSAYINGLISLDERMVVLLDVEHLFDIKHIDQSLAMEGRLQA